MKNIILFDDDSRENFLPLVFTRPVCELRCGILTIREKWERIFNLKVSFITQDYLQEKYPLQVSDDNLLINGSLLPNDKILKLITSLDKNEAIISGGELIAARLDETQFYKLNNNEPISEISGMNLGLNEGYTKIHQLWDLFVLNGQEIDRDFKMLTKGRKSEPIDATNTIVGKSPVFVEAGAKITAAIINTNGGPVYVGKNAEIMEGSMIRGPLAMCDNSVLKMGSKVYGASTLGPYCKVGGEINNVIFTGFSNKGHDGFLGNSIIGEWCNLGADTNNSNLKNNYAEVKLWNYGKKSFQKTGLQFCGLIMGDHSKCGINTMFNTGTVIGVSCNMYGAGFPRNFVPSFSWGGSSGYMTYKLDKALDTAEKVMIRRGKILNDTDKGILKHILEEEAPYRSWESKKS